VLYVSLSAIRSPKTATDSNGFKVSNSFVTAKNNWHSSIDYKHYFFHVKFEMKFSNPCKRKSMSNKKWHFPGALSCSRRRS
jgi:hypothetical protein